MKSFCLGLKLMRWRLKCEVTCLQSHKPVNEMDLRCIKPPVWFTFCYQGLSFVGVLYKFTFLMQWYLHCDAIMPVWPHASLCNALHRNTKVTQRGCFQKARRTFGGCDWKGPANCNERRILIQHRSHQNTQSNISLKPFSTPPPPPSCPSWRGFQWMVSWDKAENTTQQGLH